MPEPEYIPALGYGALTPLYDAVVRCTTRERRFKQALIRQARLRAGHRILDLAAGTGTLAIWIKESEPASNVTGVDIDRSILARAARKATRAGVDVRFDCARSDALPYPDASFDRILSSLFFHHLAWTDKVRTAREVFRVLRPGGELHVADWGKPANALMRGLFVTVQCLDGFETTRDNVAGRLVSLFVQAGFGEAHDLQAFSTMLGTLALYRAVKPAGADLAASVADTPPESRTGTGAAQ